MSFMTDVMEGSRIIMMFFDIFMESCMWLIGGDVNTFISFPPLLFYLISALDKYPGGSGLE